MMPRPFPESNVRLMPPPGMDNCDPLQVFTDGEVVISCWQMSAAELDEVNRNGGRIWVRVWSGLTAPPISAEVASPFVAEEKA